MGTPCGIIAGGSGARATANSASPHALWPAAARRTAPYSSPPADWDDPWRCVTAGSGKLGPAPVNTRLGRRECQKEGTGEESHVCLPVWDTGYAEFHGEKVLGRGHMGWSRTPQRRYWHP